MFYDLDDNVITNFRFQIESDEIKTMSLKIDCFDKTLMSSSASDLLIYGKHEDDSSYINLQTTGIDLSEWSGSREVFNIRFQGLTVSSHVLDNFNLYLV